MKATLILIAILIGIAAVAHARRQSKLRPARTEHPIDNGNATSPAVVALALTDEFKTNRVTAVIRHSDMMGDFIMFNFPKNPYDCDVADIFDFIESDAIGGSAFQGGGSPGAPICATFRKAKTRDELRAILRRVTPLLNALMKDITNGVPIPKPPPRKIVDANGKEWPECVPGDSTGGSYTAYSISSSPLVCSAEGRWVVDEAMTQKIHKGMLELRKSNERANELFRALSMRVLTHDEMLEVARFGNDINTRGGGPYNANEKMLALNNVLLIQQMLQTQHTAATKP